jgi:ankyrin repeat protein
VSVILVSLVGLLILSAIAFKQNAGVATAVHIGDIDQLKMLLESGRDPDEIHEVLAASRKYRWTPLLDAASNGDFEALSLLLEHGADVNYVDSSGRGVFVVLAQSVGPREGNSYVKIVKKLSEYGAQLDRADGNQQTALHYSVMAKNYQLSEVLLTAGADPNATNAWGAAPVHHVIAAESDLEFLELLLKHGASTTLVDRNGNSVESVARDREGEYYDQLRELLRRR